MSTETLAGKETCPPQRYEGQAPQPDATATQVTPMQAAAEIIRQSDARAADGLLDLTPLQALRLEVGRRRKHRRFVELDGVEATDGEFLAWVLELLGGLSIDSRLRFRLVLLAALDDCRRFSIGMQAVPGPDSDNQMEAAL